MYKRMSFAIFIFILPEIPVKLPHIAANLQIPIQGDIYIVAVGFIRKMAFDNGHGLGGIEFDYHFLKKHMLGVDIFSNTAGIKQGFKNLLLINGGGGNPG